MALKAVAIMGATGTGKSALAMQLAAQDDLCIIACDSMQVYRKLDIGTAKPSRDEQAEVRHALLDCADISETWNAQAWANAARKVIQSENEAGKVPLIVGGTGMYLRALLEGFAEVPAEKEGVREKLILLQQEHGTPYLHAQLEAIDAPLAARLEQHDSQRIIRGLSVFESSGIALSEWHRRQNEAKSEAKNSLDCPVFVLDVARECLRERLQTRFLQMMEQGWPEEVQWLAQQGLSDTHPVMRAVGYRQLLDHLQAECSLDEAVRDGITATRRYAKRQNTWFRNQTKEAVHGGASELFEQVAAVVARL